MRIVSGRWAGRDLVSPGGRVRPTAEALRAAWLDRLDGMLEGARVLDLCAGTGALGLEALSRGARRCDFVENGTPALHALKANIARFRLRDRTRLFRHDALAFVGGIGDDPYDVVFADPPYASSLAARIADAWIDRPFSRVLTLEHDPATEMPRAGGKARYARLEQEGSVVSFYRSR